MKDKFSKIKSLFKKYGIIGAICKVFKYIKCNILININPIIYLKTLIHKKDYINMLKKIINNDKIERIIIWRSSFGWNVPLYQRPQHIAKCMSNSNVLVFYEITKMTDDVDAIKKQMNNLFLINFKNKLFTKLLFRELYRSNKKKYIQIYSTDWVLSLNELKKYINNGFKVIYEYIDDLNPLLAGTKELPVNIREKYEYAMQDNENVYVIVTADKLETDVISKRGKEKLVFACNGVDYEHFKNINNNFKFDKDFLNIISHNKPIIGYYGALASWFDYDLIKYLSKERKDYNIVLFGIKYDDSLEKSGICDLDNVYFLGPRDYNVLQHYANKFSVCTIPFLINDITKATSPVKLFEYMALNKPIVTTAMNECKKYKSVMISNSKKQFVNLIDKAIKMNNQNDKKYFELLHKEALENTWEQKTRSILDLLRKHEN